MVIELFFLLSEQNTVKVAKLTDFSCLFNVESVGGECEVWVNESHDITNSDFELISWVEHKLDPSKTNSYINEDVKILKYIYGESLKDNC